MNSISPTQHSPSLLRSFSTTDGLMRGVELFSILTRVGSIAILPGLGPSGLFLSTTLKLLALGVFEIPGGSLSRKLGIQLSLRTSFILKGLAALFFIAAIRAAELNESSIAWTLLAVEAATDALASTLGIGAYSVAHNHRYHQERIDRGEQPNSAPPLFLASYNHSHFLRLVIPVSAGILIYLLQSRFGVSGSSGDFSIAYFASGTLVLLRMILFFTTQRETLGPSQPHAQETSTLSPRSRLHATLQSPDWWIHSISSSLSLFSTLFLMGQVFDFYSRIPGHPEYAWSMGMIFSAGILLLRTLISVILYQHLALHSSSKGILFCGILLFSTSLIALGVASWESPSLNLQFGTLLFTTLLAGIAAEGIQRSHESEWEPMLPGMDRSRWLASANAAGGFLLGGLFLTIHLFDLEVAALPVLFGFYAIASICSSILVAITLQRSSPTIQAALTKAFTQVILVMFLLLFCTESFHSVLRAVSDARSRERAEVSSIIRSLETLNPDQTQKLQSRFLHEIRNVPGLKCGLINSNGNKSGTCDPDHSVDLRQITIKEPLFGSTAHEITITFDHSSIWSLVARRIAAIFFLLLIAGLLAFYFSGRVSKHLLRQLGFILNSVNPGEATHPKDPLVYSDLIAFKKALDTLFTIKRDHEVQVARLRIAEQLEHDIRSPLLVLRMILPKVSGVTAEEKNALISSTSRITKITSDLGRIHKPIDPEGTSELFSPMFRIREALIDLIKEKEVECKGRNPIRIEFDESLAELGLMARDDLFIRAVSNLINNSIEASTAGALIRVRVKLGQDQSLVLSVVDQGRGISESDLRQVGDYGFTRQKRNGSGIGLHSVREFVTAVDAKLAVESRIGVGTTVTLWFPPKLVFRSGSNRGSDSAFVLAPSQ